MIIVDTSVWVNHFRGNDKVLGSLLLDGKVVVHEFVIGELACGNLNNRNVIIKELMNLHRAKQITFGEYLMFVDKYNLYNTGVGFVDINLLASSKLSGYPLFTYDKKLLLIASQLNLSYN